MPWCDTCQKYYAPSGLTVEGTCPQCGRNVTAEADAQAAAMAGEKTPWHFKLLVGSTVAYLVWRFVQLFGIA